MRPLQEIAEVRQQKTKFQWFRLDEILWFYHSHETFSKLLLHGINHLECGSILTFISMDEILWCYHSNEASSTVLSHGTISLVCSSNFWVCGWNSTVLPFKWNLFSSTFTWHYLLSLYFQLSKRRTRDFPSNLNVDMIALICAIWTTNPLEVSFDCAGGDQLLYVYDVPPV